MFDFFCIYKKYSSEAPDLKNPFLNISAYNNLDFNVVNYKENNYNIFILKRTKNNFPSIYQGSKFIVLIYGYLFLRSNLNNTVDKRFTAKDLNDWLLKGNKISEEYFKGSYSIFILDRKNNTITITTDPLNVKYVFYYNNKNEYLISTSLDAIISYIHTQNQNITFNWIAFYQNYLFDFVLNDSTFIQGLKIVPPGHSLRLNKHTLKIIKYWDIFEELIIGRPIYSRNKSINILNQYLKTHINSYVGKPKDSAVALTGGYDSRTITALLGNKASLYSYYSYGHVTSWDIKIPKKISSENNLSYQSFILGADFKKYFSANEILPISLSHGFGYFTQADIPYVYQNFLKNKNSILTGLFGSELIKYPSSRGLFIDEAMLSVLLSNNPYKSIVNLLNTLPNEMKNKLKVKEFKEQLIDSILKHPVISNNYDIPQKIFYYLLLIGARKYFAKEIAIERPFVENLHPFWDVDFLKILLKTPFSWVHFTWSNKKRFFINIKLHQLYAKLIFANNKYLSRYISTHATRPIFLTSYIFIPLLLLDYSIYRNKIKKQAYTFDKEIINKKIEETKSFSRFSYSIVNPISKKDLIKLISIDIWLKQNKLSLL